jgi:hypothetical protein
MGRRAAGTCEDRLETYIDGLASVIGHADRVGPLHDYCIGLMMPAERKSVSGTRLLATMSSIMRWRNGEQVLGFFVMGVLLELRLQTSSCSRRGSPPRYRQALNWLPPLPNWLPPFPHSGLSRERLRAVGCSDPIQPGLAAK